MTRSELKQYALIYTAGAKPNTFTSLVLDLILKKAAEDVAAYCVALPADKKISVVANTEDYNLATLITDFLVVDRPGVWWNAGTGASTNWRQMIPVTTKWLDEKRPNWRSAASGSPQYFILRNNVLKLHPKPNTTLTDGIWVYYGQRPFAVTDDAQYYFYGTTEYPHLQILDDAILSYFKWKALGALGKDDNYQLAENAYKREREEKRRLLWRNLAINASRYNVFQGRKIRA